MREKRPRDGHAGRISAVSVFVALIVAGCFGEDPNLTESGLGRPVVSVTFPELSAPGSLQDAEVTIENPGPGDMTSVVVAFARVGPAQGGGPLPYPIVDPGARRKNPNIAAVEPEPVGISTDAVVFRFGPLAEGESMTITFTLRVPAEPGPAANSITAYAGEDPSRARGVRLETQVER